MPLTVILAALAVAASIPLLWASVAGARGQKGSTTLGHITNARSVVLEQGMGERVARPTLRGLGARLSQLTPQSRIDSLRRKLTLAGSTRSYALEGMLVGKLAAAGLMVLLGLAAPLDGALRIAVAVFAGLIGFFLPDGLLDGRARRRQEEIQMALSDTLDQVRMAVDAGLGFEAALARVAESGEGPLVHEIHRVLREMQLGVSRDQALRNLAARTDVPDLDSFVVAVVQSSVYGIPIASVLRVQSEELRDKRRQRAEERALKIPVKLIFPLVFCIFPTIFIVLLGPAVIRMVRELGPLLP